MTGAREKGIVPAKAQDFRSLTGKGVTGMVEGRVVTVGTARYLNESNIETTALSAQAEPMRLEGQTVMFAAIDGFLNQ